MNTSVQRFREIVKVLAFYGFGYLVDSKKKRAQRFPSNLRKAFEELGPTFVKIGQILSTRPDIIPDAYIKELSKLQDKVPPEDFNNIEAVFYKEFNKSIDEVFLKFNKKPLACASIAQVHEATLKDGTNVIVKIQRPNIQEKMKLDLSILYKLATLTRARFSDFIVDPIEALDEISTSTKMELDFANEVKNIDLFKKLNSDVAFVTCPFVVHELSKNHIITMEKITGFKINDIRKLEEQDYDLNDLGKKLALSYFKQVFQDGFFHGDPHPGNILIRENKICFIDFGLMGSLSNNLKNALNDIILSVAYYDIDKIISVIMSIGIKTGYVDRNQLYEDIDYIFSSYLSASLENIKISQFLQEVFDCAKRNNVRLPKDLIILVKGFVILEGVIARISPDISILDVAIPFVKAQNKESFLKNLDINEALLNSYSFLKNSSKLPSKIIELCNGLMRGRAKLQLNIKNVEGPIAEINKMVNRLILGIIISSMIISSSLILRSNIGPKFYGISIIGITGYASAAILGFWLLISIIRSKKL
ncbi:ABC1 kinase family protein [Clostridium hydrogenum]|uniref:ABC1 kinase family protein n=1 Tax=Clostridium hydrogenum TaxID=2855764 RepID=UPI001F16361E|nr:AarF/ABC1/UbiB kinase family protein [Clostridium hydrogenum]